MFYDSVTTEYECSTDSARIIRIWLDCYDIQNCMGKYGTNSESTTNRVRIKGNSWQFLTIAKIRYKMSFTPAWALLPK